MVELIKLLIAKGADVNLKAERRATPLHFAAHFNSKEVVRILIEHGARPQSMDEEGDYPIDLTKDEEIKKLLLGESLVDPRFQAEQYHLRPA